MTSPPSHKAPVRSSPGVPDDELDLGRHLGILLEYRWSIVATLELEMSAFHQARRVELRLDGLPVQTLAVAPPRRLYEVGPLTVPPGDHALGFHPVEMPSVASHVVSNGDSRPLSFALGTWRWIVQGDKP